MEYLKDNFETTVNALCIFPIKKDLERAINKNISDKYNKIFFNDHVKQLEYRFGIPSFINREE